VRPFLSHVLANTFHIRVQRLRLAAVRQPDRVSYQRRFVRFPDFRNQSVLDIGCGGYPFPEATVLVDRFTGTTTHRYESLVTNQKPFVIADMECLPFADKRFDYVYCSHVLEHAEDPIRVCREIMRVGKRGYIETPTLAKDMLFAWAKGLHRWHVVGIGQTLCFFEYSARQLEGIRSGAWKELIFGKWWNPLQDVFNDNQDLFNVMFSWSEGFTVLVVHLDGRCESLGGSITLVSSDELNGCGDQRERNRQILHAALPQANTR
jgi:SAM-dependent methyltransferase